MTAELAPELAASPIEIAPEPTLEPAPEPDFRPTTEPTGLTAPDPRDDDAEADLLCAVLVSSGRALDDIDLAASEFFRPAHETIYAAALALHADGHPVEPTTIADYLLRRGDLKRVGGAIAIATIYGRHANVVSAPHYAAIVRERAARRVVVAAGVHLQQVGATPTGDVQEVVEHARGRIDQLADRLAGPLDLDPEGHLDDAIEAIEHGTASLPTPWDDLNHLIAGWRRGALYVVAARPGSGKSIVGAQAAADVMIRHGRPVVIASLEMTRREVLMRWMSQLGEVDLADLIRGGPSVGADQWDRISRARGVLSSTRWVVDDRSTATVADIRAAVSRCVRRHGDCGLLVVDYLQLVAPGGRHENRQTEVASISRALKVAAKNLNVPVLVMAQLNRASENSGRPPRISDLRESGSIEQDADVVLLMHRDAEQDPGTLYVGVGKNRHGPMGSFKLDWQGSYSRVLTHQWRPTDVLRAVPS
ncbi:MAG TPA: DnaB-like helicase C-terminal domain-containing protein [Micromonosporaceae bacterium]|nr:DnaB-like helicase C-terminal domain-containing protein [Micromonosporaceae bacterium]